MHEWICECGFTQTFRQPELPANRRLSEQNQDMSCPVCNDEMFFDKVELPRQITPGKDQG